MKTLAELGRYIRAVRNYRGMTQEQFAERLGVSLRSVVRWEAGQEGQVERRVMTAIRRLDSGNDVHIAMAHKMYVAEVNIKVPLDLMDPLKAAAAEESKKVGFTVKVPQLVEKFLREGLNPREGEKVPAILIERVTSLELSVRAQNCLQNIGIEYYHQLVALSEQALVTRGLKSRKSLNEIKELLKTKNLSLKKY